MMIKMVFSSHEVCPIAYVEELTYIFLFLFFVCLLFVCLFIPLFDKDHDDHDDHDDQSTYVVMIND